MKDPVLAASEALSDQAIVERVLAGETPLYEIIMRRHNTRLYRTARAVLGSESDVEDVMQDAYVLAFRHLAQFQGRSRFSTWLTRIAVREALARKHKSDRIEEWDAMSETQRETTMASREAADPEAALVSAELSAVLQDAIDRLPENFRTVLVLRDVEGMSTAETAESLSITEDNVKARLHRAHRALRSELYARASVATKDVFPFHAARCDRVVVGVFARLGRN